jgi:hypothetical protein
LCITAFFMPTPKPNEFYLSTDGLKVFGVCSLRMVSSSVTLSDDSLSSGVC